MTILHLKWQLLPLSQVAETIMGQSPDGSTYNDSRNGLPFFQGKAEFTDLYPKAVKWCSSPKKEAITGDILLSVRAPVGSTNIADCHCCIGRGLCAIRPFHGISNKYILYAIRCFSNNLESIATGTTFKAVSGKQVRSFVLPIAPPSEQKRIVDKIEELFSDLDAGEAALERIRKNIERYRASVLKAAVEGRLTAQWRENNPDVEPASELLKRILAERRAAWERKTLADYEAKGKTPPKGWKSKYKEPAQPDTTNLPNLPKGWCWTSVDTVGEVKIGRQRAPKYHNGSDMRPYLRVANVYENRIDLNDVLSMNFNPQEFKTYKLQYGDILLNEGQSPELVGRPAMFRNEMENVCFQNTLVRFRSLSCVLPDYALILFIAYLHNGKFKKIATQTINISHLSASRFADLEFPLPTIEEQASIVDEVQSRLSILDSLLETIKHQQQRSKRLRQSILKRAFEGKLVPQDSDEEPASVLLERIRKEKESPALLSKTMIKDGQSQKRGQLK